MAKKVNCSGFQFSSEEISEPIQSFIGDQAELRVGRGSSIAEFTGIIRGRRNAIHIGGEAQISRVRLEIDGDHNSITIESNSKLVDCEIRIHGNTDYGNFRGNNNLVRIGPSNSLLKAIIEFKGSYNRLESGEGVHTIDRSELFFFGFGCAIRIGNRTSIHFANLHAEEIETSIDVGEDTMVAPWVAMLAGDKHPIFSSTGDAFRRINSARSIMVGNHVWLGGGTQLLKGAHVGDNCIVGAHTTIMGPVNFDDSDVLAHNAIIHGMPARVQKCDVNWSREIFYDADATEKYPDASALSWMHQGHLYVRNANELLANDRDHEAKTIYLTAVEAYKKAIGYKDDYAYAHCALGISYIRIAQAELFISDHSRALECLRSALSSFANALNWDSKYEDPIFYREIVEQALNQLERARACEKSQAGHLAGLGHAHATLAHVEKRLFQGGLEIRELNTAQSFLDRASAINPCEVELGHTRDEIRERLQQLESRLA